MTADRPGRASIFEGAHIVNVETMHFHRRLGIYLRTNHGFQRSGKLTRRQSRRLWKKNRAEMTERRAIYAGTRALRYWT